jgi:hypothetical protein
MRTQASLPTRCGARFSAEIHTRGCHWFPRLCSASSEHACDQWYSSREPTPLIVAIANCVKTLKAADPKHASIMATLDAKLRSVVDYPSVASVRGFLSLLSSPLENSVPSNQRWITGLSHRCVALSPFFLRPWKTVSLATSGGLPDCRNGRQLSSLLPFFTDASGL